MVAMGIIASWGMRSCARATRRRGEEVLWSVPGHVRATSSGGWSNQRLQNLDRDAQALLDFWRRPHLDLCLRLLSDLAGGRDIACVHLLHAAGGGSIQGRLYVSPLIRFLCGVPPTRLLLRERCQVTGVAPF